MSAALYAQVGVLAPIRHPLTYVIPLNLRGALRPGQRVLVPLGRRKVLGIVLSVGSEKPDTEFALKPIYDRVDEEELFSPELLRFLNEVAEYYLAPIGDVLRLAQPALSKQAASRLKEDFGEHKLKGALGGRRIQIARATDQTGDEGKLRGNAPAVLRRLRATGPEPIAQLEKTFRTARAICKKLSALGLVAIETQEQARDPYFQAEVPRDTAPELTTEQSAAYEHIGKAISESERKSFLLWGVTGSGKTEVYLRALEQAHHQGKGAIVLVPEIALTPQLVNRYRARFGDSVAVLHSAMHARDRLDMWKKLRSGEVKVAIGARSALFAPIRNLGLVIVDEEHDSSFKQEEGLRYHARDMALLRTFRAKGVCVLGSATPSLESMQLAQVGKHHLLRLKERASSQAVLPSIHVVDLRKTSAPKGAHRRLSLPLCRQIDRALAAGEQTILFLNRRGFAPSLVCTACGEVAMCPLCAVALTYHRGANEVRCHYCDFRRPHTENCPSCRAPELSLEGLGTERLEEAIEHQFPDAKVARLDRDSVQKRKAEAILEEFRQGKIDILVGTQMVAKGHDIANVTVVGVINADGALAMPDFRAAERTFQILVQVAGRAGRGDLPGHVIFQTWDPKHPAVVCAKHHNVDGFLTGELESRRELAYPPFSRLALVRMTGADEQMVRQWTQQAAERAKACPAAQGGFVEILGPAPAPLARLRGRYRFRVLLRAKSRKALRECLVAMESLKPKLPRAIGMGIDVDPVSML